MGLLTIRLPFIGRAASSRTLIYLHVLILAFCLGMVGCGGGTVSVNNVAGDGERPAGKVLNDLEKAAQEEGGLEDLLKKLQGKRGDHLNWKEFWEGIRSSSIRETLYTKHAEALFSLQRRGCQTDAFRAYLKVLLEAKGDLNFVVGEKRGCLSTPVGEELAETIFRTKMQGVDAAGWDLKEAQAMVRFLRLEMERDPSGNWQAFVASEEQGKLRLLVERLLASNETAYQEEAVLFKEAFEKTTGTSLFAATFFRTLLVDNSFRNRLAALKGRTYLVRWMTRLADASILSTVPVLPTETTEVLTWLRTDPYQEANGDFYIAWNQYLAMRTIAKAVSATWSVAEQMRIRSEFLQGFTVWASAQDKSRAKVFFAERVPAVGYGSRAELITAAAEVLGQQSPEYLALQPQMPKAPTITPDVIDNLSILRIQIENLPRNSREERLKLHADVLKYCDSLEGWGFNRKVVSASQLQTLLSETLPVGCFFVDESAEASVAGNTLLAHPNSVILTAGKPLRFQANKIRLGIVDLSTDEKIPPMVAKPPAQNALVLPLLIGLNLRGTTWPNKTYFFQYHTVIREALPGDPGVKGLSGKAGGNLTLVSPDAEVGLYVAVSGEGQKAAPIQKGGKGDTSALSTDKVRDHINALNAQSAIPDEGRFVPDWMRGQIEHIFTFARREQVGSPGTPEVILSFVSEGYLDNQDPALRDKFLAYCAELAAVDASGLDFKSCLVKLTRKNVEVLRKWVLHKFPSEMPYGPTEIVKEVSSGAYSLPAAADGTPNQDGDLGEEGQLIRQT